MKIKFWGCRGSIPVPDSRMMKYGGNTTCVEVNLDGKILIIDAGTGIRRLGEDLLKRNVGDMNIFITHSHWDHIQGFPFFLPIYSEKSSINIYGYTNSYKKLKDILTHQMSFEYFPVSFSDLKSKISFIEAREKQYEINGYNIKIIQNNHPIFTIGLRIEKNDKSFIFMTDNELGQPYAKTTEKEFIEFCQGATYLIHDAQFDDKEYEKRINWGHSTYEQVVDLAQKSGIKNVGLFHHDPARTDKELVAIEKKMKKLGRGKKYPANIFVVKEMDEIEL